MRDASLSHVRIPGEFSERATLAMVEYLYHDRLQVVDRHNAVEVLQVAHYFGVPRLVIRCEHVLADVLLKSRSSERHIKEMCGAAIDLFILSHTLLGSGHLAAVALDFLCENFDHVVNDDGFSKLEGPMIALIAGTTCRMNKEIRETMKEMRRYALEAAEYSQQ